MKLRIVFFAFAVLLIGASALSAAEPPGLAVTATIPFEFRVGSSTMPAGQYSIQHAYPRGAVLFRQLRGDAIAGVLSNSTGKEIEGSRGKLVFRRYGDSYFLRQVWIPGRVGAEFAPSKAEVEQARLVKQSGKTEVAIVVTK